MEQTVGLAHERSDISQLSPQPREAASGQIGGLLTGSRSDMRNVRSKEVDMEQNRATEYMAGGYV
jgi:hypothetical protein